MKTSIDENGVTVVTDGESRWSCADPAQAQKHIATWRDGQRNGRASPIIADGDVSAINDCAADAERDARGNVKPSQRFVYDNGAVIDASPTPSTPDQIVAPKDNPVVASLARRILDSIA